MLRLEIFLGGQESPEVANWIFAEGHLAQVIFPHIGLDCPAGERLAIDGDHLSFSIHAGVSGSGYDEVHLFAFLPKGAGKFMRENQGIKAPFGGEEHDCLVGSGPLRRNIGLIPAVEIETVGMCLADQDVQNLFASHSTLPMFNRQDFPSLPAPSNVGLRLAKGRIAVFTKMPPSAMY